MQGFWRKCLIATLVGFCAGLFAIGLGHSGWLEELEWKTFDFRMRLLETKSLPPSEIALILIDEASLKMMNPVVGRWPWPRSIHADLVDFLALSGARAVAFDILFTENEWPTIGQEAGGAQGDERLVSAVQAAGNVISAMQFVHDTVDEYNPQLINPALPTEFIDRFALAGDLPQDESFNNAYLPFPQLAGASHRVGVVEFSPDRDGVYRRTRLLREYQQKLFPTLSLTLLLDRYRSQIAADGKIALVPRVPSADRNNIDLPTVADGSFLIKPKLDWQAYSIGGVLATMQMLYQGNLENLPVNPEEFRDKIVLIGASAVGVEDLKTLPFGTQVPGVFLHASILENILHGDFLRLLPDSIEWLMVMTTSLVVAWMVLLPSSYFVRIGGVLLLFSLIFGATIIAFYHNTVVGMLPPFVGMGSSWLASFVWLSSTEGKQKRKIKNMLGQYVSPAVLNTVLAQSRNGILQAEVGSRENLTILFSDIRGFTSLSEELTAEEVVGVLNGYFQGMVDIIFEQEGTLDKFIGDAIMAFWGAPLKVDNHALKGVQAAVRMVRWLDAYNQVLAGRGLQPLTIGIGLHTGEVILGNIGSEKKLEYTIIGDNVNLCSRLEGLTKYYGSGIVISEATFRELEGQAICRTLDVVRVKGKKQPIAIYEVLGLATEETTKTACLYRLAELSGEGFAHYRQRDWKRARSIYGQILEEFPGDRPSAQFLERVERYSHDEPGPEWEGIWTMKDK